MVFASELCVLDSFVDARKDAGVFCVLVLGFNKVQPSPQPQRVLEPAGVAGFSEPQGLMTDPTMLVTLATVGAKPPARLPSPGCAHPTPSSGWAESCLPANAVLDPDMSASFQGLDPKLWGLLVILRTPHAITCPRLYWGFLLGALGDMGVIHPSMLVNSA